MKRLLLSSWLIVALVLGMGAGYTFYYFDASQITSGTLAAARLPTTIPALVVNADQITGGNLSNNRLPDSISTTGSVTVGTTISPTRGFANADLHAVQAGLISAAVSTPVALYMLNAGAGTEIDYSGAGHTLTYAGTASSIGYSGLLKYLVDATGSSAQIADAADLTFGATAFSFNCWAKLNGKNDLLLRKGTNPNREILYQTQSSNAVLLVLYDETAGGFIGQQQYIASANGWHMLSFTHDGGTTAAGCVLYVDGEVTTPAAITGGSFTQMRDLTGGLFIATPLAAGGDGFGFAVLSTGAMTPAQIRRLYNSTRGLYNF
jgi:hypothetical protein